MENSKESLVDRVIRATTKPLIISGVSLIFIGAAIGIKEGTPETYEKTAQVFLPLALVYGVSLAGERYFERERRSKRQETHYQQRTA